MILRGRRIALFVTFSSLIGLCLYKAVDLRTKIPALITSKFLPEKRAAIYDDELFAVPSVYKTRESHLSNDATSKLFQNASNCLADAKRDIANYLRQSETTSKENDFKTKLEPKCKPNLLFIILVTTRPGNFANRVAIRLAWGRMDTILNSRTRQENPDFTWMSIFSVGLAMTPKIGRLVSLESDKYEDILRLPYKDSYKNLPNKTMNSLEWIGENCQPKFVLKTDDDCFINIFEMLSWLQTLPPNFMYIGRVNTHMPVIRDPKHRNYVPKEEHKENVYKPYCAGGGYILKGEIILNVTRMGKKIKQIINEDAYMGMLTNALKMIPRNEERFLPYIFFGPSIKKLNMCEWKDKFLIHNVFGKRQLTMHYNSIAMKHFHSLCEVL